MYTIKVFYSSGELFHTFIFNTFTELLACYLALTFDNSKQVIFFNHNDDSTVMYLRYTEK